jgi:biotin carboxyl carrier protein
MRKFMINVNGNSYEVEVEEMGGAAAPVAPAPQAAAPAPVAAAPAPAAVPQAAPADGTSIKAPMPGTILSVNSSVGQSVKAGDTLMILEAMKMENEILAPEDGTVKSIAVSQGASVDTGDLLVVIG